MATLNLSSNGSSIAKSYQTIVDAPMASGPPGTSPTYGQWALFSVTAPLVSAFQQGSGKESVLKVESTGEGELQDLIEDFSDGRIQFAFVKVKDPNTGLPKHALIGWCGEGVPERTKGYFSNHQAAVEKLLHGYHVQISARSDRDLTPEGIVQKISDASGAKYSAGEKPARMVNNAPPPPVKKAVFTPVSSHNSRPGYNPLTTRLARASNSASVDEDGWGDDAPPVTRTQLEKVESAYKPTKVNMSQLASQEPDTSHLMSRPAGDDSSEIVRGAYQPVGKVDIAAIRRQAKETGQLKDERPSPVRGAYEPIGKVDIAAIRAKAQSPQAESSMAEAYRGNVTDSSLASGESSAAGSVGRLSELPKPKINSRFGSAPGSFTGTKAPVPGKFGLQSGSNAPGSAPIGTGRTFASSAGKTPAQLWAEKKASQGEDVSVPSLPEENQILQQTSGGWKSGYEGKKWATVQTTGTGASMGSIDNTTTAHDEPAQDTSEGTRDISRVREQFSQASPPLPVLNITNKPNTGAVNSQHLSEEKDTTKITDMIQSTLPAPPVQPRSPSPEEPSDSGSPVKIALPVARGVEISVQNARDEQHAPPPSMPISSMADHAISRSPINNEEEAETDIGREAAESAAAATFGDHAVATADPGAGVGGHRAVAQYDYEKAEDNELELREGDEIKNIEMVDTDWWMGQNPRGESGLFPSNYVELISDSVSVRTEEAGMASQAPGPIDNGKTATALYDYVAAEDNEISFPEGAKIKNVEFPDEDWWSGEYDGVHGLFPANYVELDP